MDYLINVALGPTLRILRGLLDILNKNATLILFTNQLDFNISISKLQAKEETKKKYMENLKTYIVAEIIGFSPNRRYLVRSIGLRINVFEFIV